MENFSKEDLYEIFHSRDERYDGRFYVGVKTTGIYCRLELAPGYASIDSKRNIAYTARILLEEKMNSDTVIEDVCKIIVARK